MLFSRFVLHLLTCLTRRTFDVLLDLGLSPSCVLLFLLFALPMDIVFVFLFYGFSVVHGSSPCSLSSLSFVHTFGITMLYLSFSCLPSIVKKTFPFNSEISFKGGGPSATTNQKFPFCSSVLGLAGTFPIFRKDRDILVLSLDHSFQDFVGFFQCQTFLSEAAHQQRCGHLHGIVCGNVCHICFGDSLNNGPFLNLPQQKSPPAFFPA